MVERKRYELTAKGMEMANRLSSTRGIKSIMGNSTKSSSAEEVNKRVTKISSKDPDHTTISAGVARPLRMNDTVADILAKMYNFMRRKYTRDLKEHKQDDKYRKKLIIIKERRIEELITLFKGKYKKSPFKSSAREEMKRAEQKETNLVTKVTDAAKKTIDVVKDKVSNFFGKAVQVTPAVATAAKIVAVGAGVGAAAVASSVIAKEEGVVTKGYWDPPNQKKLVSIGYGHQITDAEYSQGYIQAGDERVPIQGERGIDTRITKEQAKKIFETDVPKYEAQAKNAIGPAWNKLNANQQAAIIDYTYNAGVGSAKNNNGLYRLINQGLVEKIEAGDMKGASDLIRDKGVRTAKGVVNEGLVKRRANEAKLFMEPVTTASAPVAPKVTPVAAQKPAIPEKIVPVDNSSSGAMLNNSTTNIINSGTTYASSSDDTKSTAPILDLQYR